MEKWYGRNPDHGYLKQDSHRRVAEYAEQNIPFRESGDVIL
jgi:hypothetical protein